MWLLAGRPAPTVMFGDMYWPQLGFSFGAGRRSIDNDLTIDNDLIEVSNYLDG